MVCPKCGRELPDTAKFCGDCGHQFEKSGNKKQAGCKTKKPAEKFAEKFIKTFAITLVCFMCLSILVCFDPFHMWHDWEEATCTEPKSCSTCGKTEGEALWHDWEEATCTEPKTCNRCGETEGKALGHSWEEATCTEPKTCNRCGETGGKALGHDWEEATCTRPQICSRCRETIGEPLGGHDWMEATCTEPKTCSKCGTTWKEALGHEWSEGTCMERITCHRCHEEKTLGRHKMDNSTGICEICGKALKIELDTSNWFKYLETSGTSVRSKGEIYRFQDVVIEADWQVVRSRGPNLFGEGQYSLMDVQRFRAELDYNGSGSFESKSNESYISITMRHNIERVSGTVIIGMDEYVKRGIKERNDL